jgi:hypothetical protein
MNIDFLNTAGNFFENVGTCRISVLFSQENGANGERVQLAARSAIVLLGLLSLSQFSRLLPFNNASVVKGAVVVLMSSFAISLILKRVSSLFRKVDSVPKRLEQRSFIDSRKFKNAYLVTPVENVRVISKSDLKVERRLNFEDELNDA